MIDAASKLDPPGSTFIKQGFALQLEMVNVSLGK
jgi:hypothetical protein